MKTEGVLTDCYWRCGGAWDVASGQIYSVDSRRYQVGTVQRLYVNGQKRLGPIGNDVVTR